MKILIVNKFLYPNGGSETYIFKIGNQLKSMGNEVEYFGMEHSGRCVENSAQQYTSEMDFHNCSTINKLKLSLKTIYSKEAKKKINVVLNDFKPDIIHLNNFNFQLTPSIIYACKQYKNKVNPNAKIIYTAHDYQLLCPNHSFCDYSTMTNCEKCINGKFINCTKNKCIHNSKSKSLIGTIESSLYHKMNTYNNIDTIICCSDFMKNKMDSNKIFKNKTVAMHNFIDIDNKNNEKKQENTFDLPQKYVLYFGRFSKEKGVNTLIEVAKQMKNVQFVFAGNGELEDKINQVENIKNVGFQSGEQLKNIIINSEFTLCPSECYENCPFSVMESISYGIPVIGSNIGGIPELIDDNINGILFESGNQNSLKSAIEKLYNNRELVEKLSNNCKDTHFKSTKEYCDDLIKIYNK